MAGLSSRGGGAFSSTTRAGSACAGPWNGSRPVEQLVEDHAQAVDVAAGVGVVAAAGRLLRRHVRQRAQDAAVGGRRRLGLVGPLVQPRQAEVEHVRLAGVIDEDVARLQVAVADALARGRTRPRRRSGRPGRPPRRGSPAAGGTRPRVHALDVLGDQVARRPLAAVVEQLDDAGVAQPGGARASRWKRADGLRLVEAAGVQHLDGDAPLDVGVVGQVDDAEAAGAQLALDPVGPDALRQRAPAAAAGAVADRPARRSSPAQRLGQLRGVARGVGPGPAAGPRGGRRRPRRARRANSASPGRPVPATVSAGRVMGCLPV